MKNWFNIGMGSGLLIGLLFFFFTSREKKNEKVIQWDERQIALRGECYRIGFFVVVISSSLIATYSFLFGKSLFETPEVGHMASVIIGVLGFSSSAIMKDAYYSLHENRKKYITTSISLALVFGVTTGKYLVDGSLVVDGKLADRSIVSFVFLLWCILAVLQIVHSKKEDEESEES